MNDNRENINKYDWEQFPEDYEVLSEKQMIVHLGTVADEIYNNGAYSMYGHSLLKELMESIYDLANSKGIKLNTPAYNEKD
tara:strand:+ start:1749 stop:1991 length:243 start_codon:yes stop_codon:yes gene_type:complete